MFSFHAVASQHTIIVFFDDEPATAEQIDKLILRLNHEEDIRQDLKTVASALLAEREIDGHSKYCHCCKAYRCQYCRTTEALEIAKNWVE